MQRRASVRIGVLTIALCVPLGATAVAQSQQERDPRWELLGYGGFSLARVPEAGSLSLPAPGAPLPSTLPTFPARRAPSWFFGDGAAMLNDALAELGASARVAPLDDALAAAGLGGNGGPAFGLRVRARVGPRVRAEMSLDVLSGSASFPASLADAADATLESFDTAMSGLFATGPFTNVVVDTGMVSGGGSTREIAFTGALNYGLRGGRLRPYVTIGGGILKGTGGGESRTLEGRYRASTVGGAPDIAIDETDVLTIRYARGRSYVGVAGLGVDREVGGGWAINVDGRVFFGSNNARLQLDATPTVVRSVPAGFIETLTYPNIQFSTDPSSGRESSLSGSLEEFDAFKGSGMQTRVLVTVGVIKRF